MARYALLPVAQLLPLAKAALARALELEPTHAEAMGALALVSLFLEHDVDAAFAWWERALELQPRLSEVRGAYAVNGLYCIKQDDARALAELARAVADDPLSANCAGFNSAILALTGHAAAAMVEATRSQELDPHSFTAAYGRLMAFGRFDETGGAIAAANETIARFGRHPMFVGMLVNAYLRTGDTRRAEAAYTELLGRSEIDVVQRSVLALAASILGRADEAVRYALESVERCDALNPGWARLPFATDAVRAHPRYPELLRAMGL